MLNILVLDSGTQGLIMVRELHKAGYRVVLLTCKDHNYADDSRYVDKKVIEKYDVSTEGYLHQVISVIKSEHISTIIPLGDKLAEFVSINKDVLLEYVKFLAPDYDIFQSGYDKSKLMSICQEYGYPHPFTITGINSVEDIKETDVTFPLLIKPNITCGARGMTLVDNFTQLKEMLPLIQAEYGECHLQKYIRQGGAQVEVQLFLDRNHELISSSVIYKHRWYPEKGGSSCCAKSVVNNKIVGILHDLLRRIGWVGFADFDTIEDPDTGELLIMELNPRVPACVKTAFVAGINWAEIIVNGYLGLPQKEYHYKENEYLRHLGFEVLWFLKSPNRFNTYPNWFKFFGSNIHYQDMSDWSDPLPWIMGTLRNVKKVLLHEEKKKL